MNMGLLLIVCFVALSQAAKNPEPSRPDIYGLINILYLKADSNFDSHITQAELSAVFKGFDKNGDGTVTNPEFIELWIQLTSQTTALANAYFHLADLNVDNVIDSKDYPMIYNVFDLDHDGSVSAREFAKKWEDIIRETPFVVLFERSDSNADGYLSHQEFRGYFSSFDTNGDGSVNNAEFDEGWKHADFALLSDADLLFGDLDKNTDGSISGHGDMDILFSIYDSNSDNKLSLLETIKMKSLLVLIQAPGTVG
ncbi:EF-hand domain [Mactra antiquata]